jgi:hypothetical protein
MKCVVYKGMCKQGTYLYVASAETLTELPKALLDQLGELQQVMDLDLTPHVNLAAADPAAVMNSIESRGFYLQLPPGAQTNTC